MNLRRRLALAAVLGVLGAGVSTAPAPAANGFSIGITGPSTGALGRPLTLTVSGQNPTPGYPDYHWFATWLSVDVIPASVVSSCPETEAEGIQLGVAHAALGGGYLVLTQREPVNETGAWSATVGYAPNVPGPKLICAYSDDGETHTLAKAQHAIDVSSAGATTANKRSAGKKCRRAKRSVRRTAQVASAAKKCRRRKR